ncbi:unnamed protein product [Rhizoctonia solani]|nr:unnamed protein product [Rhizoctonia solani]
MSVSPSGSPSLPWFGCLSLSGSGSRPYSPSQPQYLQDPNSPQDLPHAISNAESSPSSPFPTFPCGNSLSDEEDPCLQTRDASADIDFFGQELANLRISGPSKVKHSLFYNDGFSSLSNGGSNDGASNGGDDDEDNEDDENDEDDEDDEDNGPLGRGGGNPGEPDGQEGAEVAGPQMQVPPDDPGGAPGAPGDNNEPFEIPALDEHSTLRNIYLRTWTLYAFHGATQEIIQAVLESHKLALLAGQDLYPPEFIVAVHAMPTTLRSLERRLGMDFSELITIFPVCPECGRRYSMEQLNDLRNPQCLRHVGDRCQGVLYVETKLADGTQKRTPTKSFPYNSLPAALGRLLSRVGIADLIQHWRRNPDDAPLENPPGPEQPQQWLGRMDENTRFSDISQAWGWHAQATGLKREFVDGEFIDVPVGNLERSLARSSIGLSLGVGADGYQVFKGKFAAAGSYSANGIYIVINNLPFFQRNLIENMILAVVLPGPHEPKGYAFDQMIEPLVKDLIKLAAGVELPVYDSETGEIRPCKVYANLSVLIVDWIARIKCTGHVGVAAEENHCPYCKIRQCLLATPEGYQSEGYDPRDPHDHLQDKHRVLRAPLHEREAIRLETGTSFTEFDRVPGFYAFDNAPIDAMHLLDLGITQYIARTIIFKHGMLRKRFRGQDDEDSPEARFNAFLARTIFPHHCSRIPTQAKIMDGRTKAEQWRLLRLVMPVAYFEAWRDGDAIPDGNIPRGGRNTKHFKTQEKSARLVLRRRRQVHHMDDGDPEQLPELNDCVSSRNPRDYYANILRYCLANTLLTRHRVTLAEIEQGAQFMEQVGIVFADMNVHLTPSFHAATHLPDHIRKYGSIYNTLTARFERANRLMANVNTNGHGHGVLEATMAKGFLRRTECHRYVHELQSIEEPTIDDTKTTEVLLGVMRNGPEHEVQRGMLDAILAGQAPMHGQEEIRLATTPARINFRDADHRDYYALMVDFCNRPQNRPAELHNVVFYGHGLPPAEGDIQVHVSPNNSTLAYPHFRRYGVRYGSAKHSRGLKSRYGYIFGRVPVLIQGIYETKVEVQGQEHKFLAVMVQRFVAPDLEPAFPWNHWNEILGIDAWLYNQLAPLEAVPPTVFTGVFALSDLEMTDGHFWITIAMINTRPEDLAEDDQVPGNMEHDNMEGDEDDMEEDGDEH